MLVSKARLADIIGKSEQTISNWLEEGLPRVSAGGRGVEAQYDTAEVIRWMIARECGAQDENGNVIVFEAERARLTKEQADKVAMENEVRRGKLVDAEHVAALWANLLTNVKNRMLAIPTRCAPLVVGRKSIPEVREIVRRPIMEALNELASADPTTDPSSTGWTYPAAGSDGEPVGGPAPKAKRGKQRRAGAVVNG